MAAIDRSEKVPMKQRARIADDLEVRFRHLTDLLYDTSIPPEHLEREVLPWLAETVVFQDPWQSGCGRDRYALGMKGFHAMFDFRFETRQVSVALDEGGERGRALVDGVMHLRQSSRFFTYPLRTILHYGFTLSPTAQAPSWGLQLTTHEEMWSLGDMIEALPLVGRLYAGGFRPLFARGFLLASRLALSRRSQPVPPIT
jgi:hypothetical protein